jgi:drug/metabolite transporter (DMT)-like permease
MFILGALLLLPGACGVLFMLEFPNWLATVGILIGLLGVVLLVKVANWNKE